MWTLLPFNRLRSIGQAGKITWYLKSGSQESLFINSKQPLFLIHAVLYPGTAVILLFSSTSLVRRLTQGSQFLPREHFYYELETLYSTFFLLGVLPPNAQELCTSYPYFEANDTYGSTLSFQFQDLECRSLHSLLRTKTLSFLPITQRLL